jgi:hypothetical protein
MSFVEAFLEDALEVSDPQTCHNLLRITRRVWAYESNLRLLDVSAVMGTLEAIPLTWKYFAADILDILRDFVCPQEYRETFILKIFSLMEQILGLFDSRRITKRVCTTAIAVAARYSVDLVEIAESQFFAALIQKFGVAVDYPARKFPPEFFSLLSIVAKRLEAHAAVDIFHAVSENSYWWILLSGTPDAAQACLEFVCFFCRMNGDDARVFATSEPWTTSSTWMYDPETSTGYTQVLWIQFCHTLFLALGEELVPFLLDTNAIQIAANIIASGAGNRDCVHLIYLILEATAGSEDRPRVLLGLGDPVPLVQALSEIVEDAYEPGLGEEADKILGFLL